MHVLLGLFVAAALLYWWARGSVIVAIMGSLAAVGTLSVGSGAAGLAAAMALLSWGPVIAWRVLKVQHAPSASPWQTTAAIQFRR